MAANLAVRHETPVALFTLEMSKTEVTQRLMCSEAKVESQRLRTGKLAADDWPRLTAACDKLAKAPIYVDDTGSITMMEIRSKARRLKSREPGPRPDHRRLPAADDLGPNAENRVQEVSQISRSLKVLARDLDVPIIALSQLSRAVEQRHDKRPILSDLRESGSIEQDADLVMFIYRDEYYNEESDQQGLAEVIVAKHRNGPDRHDEALVPEALREVRGPGRMIAAEQTIVLGATVVAFTAVCAPLPRRGPHRAVAGLRRAPADRRRPRLGRLPPRPPHPRRPRGPRRARRADTPLWCLLQDGREPHGRRARVIIRAPTTRS